MKDYLFPHRADIQGLRGVAVLLVALFHAQLCFSGGFVGVDAFFVISGFVICGGLFKENSAKGSISLKNFYSRRVRRLLPSLAALSVLVLLASAYLAPYSSLRFATNTGVAATFFNANHYLLRDVDYFDAASEKNVFLHTWSLSVEEQFYMMLPLIMWAVVRRARRTREDSGDVFFRMLAPVFACSFLASALIVAAHGAEVRLGTSAMRVQMTQAFYLTPLRAWEFGVGGLLAARLPALGELSLRKRQGLRVVGGALLLASAMFYSATTPFPGAPALLPVLGTLLLIRAGCGAEEAASQGLLASPWLVRLGDLSYGWYLWHWPLLLFARASVPDLSRGLLGAVLLLSLGVAWLNERWVETPFRKRFSPSHRTSVAFLVVCLVLPIISWRVHKRLLAALESQGPIKAMVEMDRTYRTIGCVAAPYKHEQTSCRWGRTDATWKAVLIGDSNARQYIPALATVVPKLGGTLQAATFNSCAFSGLRPIRQGIAQDACVRWLHATLDELERHPPDLLIISSIYDEYLDRPHWSFTDPSAGADAGPIAREEVADRLDASVSVLARRLRARGIKIVFVKPIPKLFHKHTRGARPLERYDGMDCAIARWALDGGSCNAKRPLDAGEVWMDRALGRRAYRSALTQSGVYELVVDDAVCPQGTCATLSEQGRWIYRDQGHLAPYGAALTAPRFEAFLREHAPRP